MSRLVFCLVLFAILACTSVEGTFGTILRGYGLNGQYYTGSGVGPLWLFRSSADNAAIVNQGLVGNPIQRAIALALGDEFPKLRDDLIQRAREGSRYGARAESETDDTTSDDGSSSASTNSTGTARASPLAAFTNFQNWRYDRENSKNEFSKPYRRPIPYVVSSAHSLAGSVGSRIRSASGSGGLLSSVTGLISSFASGGSSSLSSSSGSSGPDRFRISVE